MGWNHRHPVVSEPIAARHADPRTNFSAVPTDRPLLGLVVTLEPYYLRETFRDEMLKSDVLPVSIAGSHELENACEQLSPAEDVGAQLLNGLTPKENPLVVTAPCATSPTRVR